MQQFSKSIFAFLILMFISTIPIFIPTTINCQTVTGASGLVKIPNTEVNSDKIAAGFFIINNNNVLDLKYNDNELRQNSTFVYFVTLGFLPFIELSFRGVKIGADGEALGDRMFNVKIKLATENHSVLPNISCGINDIVQSTNDIETQNFHSTYVVISKSLNSYFPIKLVLGYGFELLKARAYDLSGFWYGIEAMPLRNSRISIEYDSKYVNVGIDYKMFNLINISLSYFRQKYYGFGFGFELPL